MLKIECAFEANSLKRKKSLYIMRKDDTLVRNIYVECLFQIFYENRREMFPDSLCRNIIHILNVACSNAKIQQGFAIYKEY